MAEPISITVGGNSHWGVAIVDNEMDTADGNGETDDIAISNDVELKFSGSTVLDSGVEVGVRIEIEGEESKDQGDETYMYVEGSFGEIRIGNDDAASYQMSTTAPYATFFYGINTPNWTGTISGDGSNWHSTLAGADVGSGDGDSASMMYFSPVLNGFQFGMSYAPEAGAEARSGTAKRAKDGDAYSVGARYDGAFGDAGVTISAGYTSQDVPMTAAGDPAPARRTVMRGIKASNWYLVHTDNSSSTGTLVSADDAPNVRVFENPDWDPSKAHDDETQANIDVGRYRVPIVSNDDATNGTITGGESPSPADYVYKYIEAAYDEPATAIHDVDYMTKGEAAMPGRTVSDYSVGAVVSMSGVSVGGSYRNTDHDSKADDTVQYDVGISYGEGPWVVSANYGAKTQDDDGEGNKTDNGYARLMANYNLGPGINLAGVIGQDSTDSGDDTSFAGIAMGISF